MLKITAGLLQKLDACEEQVAHFREVFPHGADLTLENLTAARAQDLDVDWLPSALLSLEGYRLYNAAREKATVARSERIRAARAEFDEQPKDGYAQVALAIQERSDKYAAAYTEFDAALDAALDEVSADPANLRDGAE